MVNSIWSKGHSLKLIKFLLFYTIIFGTILAYLFTSPNKALAAVDDPASYTIISYDYILALGIIVANSVPDIYHNDTVTIHYGTDSNMSIVPPPEVSNILAKIYHITDSGQREDQYTFFW
ncbi:MAG: hypothetical protein H6779_02295 [Candidatus Nomurabacteria bacterium]|nr:hypothetical protein [Candidatus Nomurabacteria bacterium]USN88253.1 MAG: hypothetical protein H6779_02295 [Candidatus Nomurabacteria bacterium]